MKKTIFLCLTIVFCFSTLEGQNSDNPALDYINLLEADINDLNTTFYLNTNDSDVDSHGNLIVVGDFNGSIDLDPSSNDLIITASPSPPGNDHPFRHRSSFIAKYNPSGGLIWGYKLGDNSNMIFTEAVKIDHHDNISITGLFKYNVDFDLEDSQHILSSPTTFKTFVANYDDDGTLNWANKIDVGTTGYSAPLDIDVKNNGNVVVAGQFNGQLIFSGPTFPLTLNNNSGSVNSFFAELNTSGNWVAARHVQSPNAYRLESIIIDSNNNVVCNMRESIGTTLLSRTIVRYNTTSIAPVNVIKLQPGTNTSLVVGAMNIDGQDNIYIGGYFKGTIIVNNTTFLTSTSSISRDAYLVKINALDNVSWKRTIVPAQEETYTQYLTINNIEVDDNDRLIITGALLGKYKFSNSLGLSAQDKTIYNSYVAKFDQQGTPKWASVFQGYSITNSLNSFTINLFDNQFYVYGTLKTKTDFDLGYGINNVNPAYNDPDPFIAKYTDVPTLTLKNNLNAISDFTSFPTLVEEQFNLVNLTDKKETYTLKIYNLSGAVSLEKLISFDSKKNTINTNTLKQGLHVVKVLNSLNEVIYTTKIIKQ